MGGFFDILHSGHILAMSIVKSHGDYLVINVSPDNRAKKKKGKGRPILSVQERVFCVDSLRIVDETVSVPYDEAWNEDDYQIICLKAIKPDVCIRPKNSKRISKFCKDNNIKMKVFRGITGFDRLHSSDIIKKINSIKEL